MNEALLQVSGMTCGACTASITEALDKMEGVNNASVSLITEQAKVSFSDPLTVDQIKETIENCGFDVELVNVHKQPMESKQTIETNVNIQGMTCGSCSASITQALEAIEGVSKASISLMTESGLIIHTSAVTPHEIVDAIEGCGFDCQVVSSGGPSIRTTIAVKGMTCAACTGTITETLQKLPGVTKALVSLITEEAVVDHSSEVSVDTIITSIEDCGFEASLILSNDAASDSSELEEVSFQIQGIHEQFDLASLQYNLEALLNSMDGVVDFQIAFKDHELDSSIPIITSANSHGVQALRALRESSRAEEEENLIDELVVTYEPQVLGIRDLVDRLDALENEVSFHIVNSLDQALLAQLKMLSRAKDVEFWRRNFVKLLVCGLPVLVMSYTQNTNFWKQYMLVDGLFVVTLLEGILTLYIYLKLGAPFLKKFRKFVENRGRNATMDVLVSISTLVSFAFSVVSVVRNVWYGVSEKPPKVLFETVAMLVSFVSFGKWLENKAKGATSTALSKLLSLTPSSCTIVTDLAKYEKFMATGTGDMAEFATRTVSIDLIQTNDVAVVLAGAKVPADGIIVYGQSEIDESLITGEHLPVFKQAGDSVIGGSINGPDIIHIKVVRSGKRSQLQQIINLVKDSQVNKAPVQRFADYVAARFVPGVVFLALVTFVVWTILCFVLHPSALPMVFRNEENGTVFVCLKIAISVVVVACPCALGLAAPTAVMVGTGVGAHHGVLIKGGDILEAADSVGIVLFDKTGTLTTGEMNVVHYSNLSSLEPAVFWELVGSVEVNSEHPIGKSITRAARRNLGLELENDTFSGQVADFKVMTGLGVRGSVTLDGTSYNVLVCNERMIRSECPDLLENEHLREVLKTSTNTLAHVIINSQYLGYIELTDGLKDDARDVVDYLRNVAGYQVGIVTGDNSSAAAKIGKQLNIPECNIFSEVTPVNKDKIIMDLKSRLVGVPKSGVAFVGDGINDAPALAKADIGIAISCGTDIAMESADIVVLGSGRHDGGDLGGVVNALMVSNATFSRVKLNFIWAAVYNLIMLPFAMGCFLPLNLMLPPVAAAGSMALSSVSVVLSSLMLKRWTPPNLYARPALFDTDYESTVGLAFDLKRGTAQEFDMMRRNRSRMRRFSAYVRRMYKGRSTQSAHDAQYEMLPLASP